MLSVESHFQQDLHLGLFNMDSHLPEPYTDSGLEHSDQASFSTPLQYFDNSTFILEGTHDTNPHPFYQSASLSSGAKSAPRQPTEQPPSTFSSASGPSVPSASSSTIGSPYSNHAHSTSFTEPWMGPGHSQSHGLGLDPAIATGEDFGPGFSVPEIDHEMDLPSHGKLPADFVGESTNFSSKSRPQSTPFSNAHLSPPSLAIRTTLDDAAMTIDSILENATSAVTSPAHNRHYVSGRAVTMSPTQIAENLSFSQSKDREVFKTPTTPASAAAKTPNRLSPPCGDRSRSQSLPRSATTPHRTQSQPSPLPNAAFHTNLSPVQGPFGSSFFAQSSAPFVPPLSSSYPSLISTPRTPYINGPPSYSTEAMYPPISAPSYQQTSPAPSPTPSQHDQNHQGYAQPHIGGPFSSVMPYYQHGMYRPASISSSAPSPVSGSADLDDDGQKGRCPHPDCGRVFKDLKAHMLTHQSERPEKCPIANCEYNQKGFARKYDKNRHTLTHYKGTMVCGFCPGSGSSAEKSFNRADVFKRHLTSVHGVEQTPPNSRKRSPTSTAKKITSYCQDATGKCSTCSATFSNAQDFYEHLDDCVLRVVQQEEPSEAINQQHLASVSREEAVMETMERHRLTDVDQPAAHVHEEEEEEDEDDEDDEDDDPSYNGRSGRGSIKASKPSGNNRAILGSHNAVSKSSRPSRKGLTLSKGGVPLIGKGRKKRKHYPPSWGVAPDKMKMKKRVLCVYDGQRRLLKDEMMLGNEFEVRMKLPDGKSYVTDLDVETIKRTEGFHGATEEERGPLKVEESESLDLEELMA